MQNDKANRRMGMLFMPPPPVQMHYVVHAQVPMITMIGGGEGVALPLRPCLLSSYQGVGMCRF